MYFRPFVISVLVLFSIGQINGQYYDISWKKEIAPITVGIGLTALGTILQNNAPRANLDEINSLMVSDLNFLDRGVIGNNSSSAQTISDVVLYSSIAYPFITFASSKCRTNTGAILVMTTEVALLTNGLTSFFKGAVNRHRPFNYDPTTDEAIKLGESSRKSFISGHTSSVSALTFLTARIITDLHPDAKHKGLIWGAAIAAPAVIGYLRVQAGKHFPTDVIAGYAVGATIGYFIPQMHLVKNENVSLTTNGISGINLSVKF